ncbi:MAG: hypothetical protein NVS1B16_11870 [Pseudarthrobacter sp.]
MDEKQRISRGNATFLTIGALATIDAVHWGRAAEKMFQTKMPEISQSANRGIPLCKTSWKTT